MGDRKLLLVGDNPFHGVSHVSQQRANARGKDLADPAHATEVVRCALESGADGFNFTVSDTTLAILRRLDAGLRPRLYPLVPNVSEFVRTAAMAGGIPGLARRLAREVIVSRNTKAITGGLKGVISNDPAALLRSLVNYEVSRLRSAMRPGSELATVMLHEVVTDMALGLNLRWLFEAHITCVQKLGVKPGFETRNFGWLVSRFAEWGIDPAGVAIASPFNAIGFQMSPSKAHCEEALLKTGRAEVIGFSILAAGHLTLPAAIEYISTLPNVAGVAVGVSTVEQASRTFEALSERFGAGAPIEKIGETAN